MVTNEDIKIWIEQALPDAKVEMTGDGHHFNALVVCNQFDHKNKIARHRMIYAALGERMGGEIHALSLQTLTEEEYKNSMI